MKKFFKTMISTFSVLLILALIVFLLKDYLLVKNVNIEASVISAKNGTLVVNFQNNSSGLSGTNFKRGNDKVLSKAFTVTGTSKDSIMKYHISLNINFNDYSTDSLYYLFTGNNPSNNGTLVHTVDSENKKALPNAKSSAQVIDLGTGMFAANSNKINHDYELSIYYPNGDIKPDCSECKFSILINVEPINE